MRERESLFTMKLQVSPSLMSENRSHLTRLLLYLLLHRELARFKDQRSSQMLKENDELAYVKLLTNDVGRSHNA